MSLFMQKSLRDMGGALATVLVMWTAFASVFSLLLGYSRVPYAAALDGNYSGRLPRCIRIPVSTCFAAGARRGGNGCSVFSRWQM